jgi:hypothetical protein
MMQLDETGPAYVIGTIHPYFINQPEFWTPPAYQNGRLIENNPAVLAAMKGNSPPTDTSGFPNSTTKLYRLSNF